MSKLVVLNSVAAENTLPAMNAIIEQWMRAPALPEIVDELQARLAAERVRREVLWCAAWWFRCGRSSTRR